MKLCLAAMISIGLLVPQGCVAIPTARQDVSANQAYWGGTRVGETYEIRSKVFLCLVREGDELAIYPPGHKWYPSLPASIEEYEEAPHVQYFPPVQAVIGPGTRLTVYKLERWTTFKGNWGVSTLARIIDGPYKDQSVNIDGVLELPAPTWNIQSGKPRAEFIERIQ